MNDMTAHAVPYMERSRLYYEAQGFEKPYVWATHEEVPLAPLARALADCTLTVITTASLCERLPLKPRSVTSGETANMPERLYANDLSWDKEATHLEDLNSYFPIDHLNALADSGRIGALARRFHCAPTEYSQRKTNEADAPDILARCQEDGVDIALLIPL
ncbi:MAG: hypothetical protein QF921_05890 [Pseudomonadales bacterium]|jgi:hypothetical protein|nr:hypothetical protein [Pseudomonadales bacterium]MDP6470035.1 hypothetical protein [Pseudomonadales bacterium]MDP6826935.1 hypothetical protein [Pseudomonadales bacterium]MDP6971033.1 hypothetical protein [Pseudomonadales bacterium]